MNPVPVVAIRSIRNVVDNKMMKVGVVMTERTIGSNIIKLSSRVMLRKEHFGGILFNKDTGDIVELDRDAYIIISILKNVKIIDMQTLLEIPITLKGRRIASQEIKGVLHNLRSMGIVKAMPKGVIADDLRKKLLKIRQIKTKWPQYQYLSAPETVHWAVTFECGESCPDCYVERYKSKYENELDTKDALSLIDKMANNGVFQIAIGGGEPFVRNDLEIIACHAAEKGLSVHITTGKYQFDSKRLDILAKHIKTLQIGIRADEFLHKKNDTAEKLRILVTQLRERKIMTGANLIMSRSSIKKFHEIIEGLMSCGFKRYTLLRYKPPAKIKRWLKEKPGKEDLDVLETKLTEIVEKHTDISIRIDCALSFLERRLDPDKAINSGIKGCVAGDRILSIAPDGSVFPCSQLVDENLSAGNLLKEDFESIWFNSKVFNRYRSFRNIKGFKNSDCGKCIAKKFCGGCRVFSDDALGSDLDCLEPLYEPKYWDDADDIISDIQDVIGCTDAGYPYATREEIEKWLEDAEDRNYPLWIKDKNLGYRGW